MRTVIIEIKLNPNPDIVDRTLFKKGVVKRIRIAEGASPNLGDIAHDFFQEVTGLQYIGSNKNRVIIHN